MIEYEQLIEVEAEIDALTERIRELKRIKLLIKQRISQNMSEAKRKAVEKNKEINRNKAIDRIVEIYGHADINFRDEVYTSSSATFDAESIIKHGVLRGEKI
jgi:hypothetical protein